MSERENRLPPTRWTLIQQMKKGTQAHRSALDELLRSYWRPVYQFICHGWGRSREEAKDLTQEFFVHLMERKVLERADPDVGTLRSLLMTALRNFLLDAHRSEGRLKRGGGSGPVPIEGIPTDKIPSAKEVASVFDREWAALLMQEAVQKVREELTSAGKEAYFAVFEKIDVQPTGQTYKEIAEELRLKESDVRNRLAYARELMRRTLLAEIARYCGTQEQVVEEFRGLFGGR